MFRLYQIHWYSGGHVCVKCARSIRKLGQVDFDGLSVYSVENGTREARIVLADFMGYEADDALKALAACSDFSKINDPADWRGHVVH